MKTFYLLLVLFLINGTVYSQVTSVDYQMKYDTSTCLYDCYIIVQTGVASNNPQRIQFSSQYSIVTPNTSMITNVINHMPLQDNANYDGTVPAFWNIATSTLSPEIQPENNFYGITPTLAPVSRYNNLEVGDTIKVFSLEISNHIYCNDEIRIYDNDTDPDSSQPGMGGGDYSNGFTIGGFVQTYNTNAPHEFPITPVILTNTDDGIIADMINEACCIDTIFFDSSTNGTNITIGSEIVILDEAVIVGNGVDETVLDGELLNRIFHIMPGSKLTLQNMTLTKAYEPYDGGAIYNEGTLVLENVVLMNNFESNLRKPLTNMGNIVISSNNVIIKQ